MTHSCGPRGLQYLAHERIAPTRDNQVNVPVLKGRSAVASVRVSTAGINIPGSSVCAECGLNSARGLFVAFQDGGVACASAILVYVSFCVSGMERGWKGEELGDGGGRVVVRLSASAASSRRGDDDEQLDDKNGSQTKKTR